MAVLKRQEDPGEGIKRIILKEITQIIAKQQADTEERTRIYRVGCKKVRAWLKLIRGAVGEGRYRALNGGIHAVALSLAPSRLAFTWPKLLSALEDRPHRAIDPEVSRVIEGVLAKRAKDAAAIHTDQKLANAAEGIWIAHETLQAIKVQSDTTDCLDSLHDTYHRSRRAFRLAKGANEGLAFHLWRKSVKTLCYQMKPLRPIQPRHLDKLDAELDELSTCLGLDHDLGLLMAMVVAAPEDFGADAVREVMLTAETWRRHLQSKALHAGHSVYERSADEFIKPLSRRWRRWNE